MRISDWSSDVCSSDLGRHIVFIGHRGHPEVIGTFGQVPPGSMTLVETVADAEALVPADPGNLAFLTQTTLSVDDTAEIVATRERRFPAIEPPRAEEARKTVGEGKRESVRVGLGGPRTVKNKNKTK